MPNIETKVTTCEELKKVLDILIEAAKELKAGKDAISVVTTNFPMLLGAFAALSELSNEVIATNSVAVDVTIALAMIELKKVFFPGVI